MRSFFHHVTRTGRPLRRFRARARGALGRAQNRSMTTTGKATPAERSFGRPAEPTVCESCGAVFRNRRWRRGPGAALNHRTLAGARWESCPGCTQAKRGEYLGRVVVSGAESAKDVADIRRRIGNVGARAEWTQPERRIVSIERIPDGLEVLTTSQKLAHRIVHELKKTFGGRASYRWSDDGSLFATWRSGGASAPRGARPRPAGKKARGR